MIYITEDIPEKLVGVSSLFIYLDDYNFEIVQFIKSLGTFYENNKTKEIEVPTTFLSKLLDYLVYFDDVLLDVINYDEISDNKDLILEHKSTPLPHQIEGIKYGLNHQKFLLLDAPGLGKTLQATYLAEELKEQEGIEHCLIVCGVSSLRTNWKREIEKHSNLSCKLLGARINKKGKLVWESIPKRVEQLMSPIEEFFIITNIESLRSEKIINALNKGPNKIGMIVVDEIHCCSGYDSIQGKNLLELEAPYKIAMTGTLITKNPISAYTPLVWIGQEKKKSVTKFKNTYCNFDPNILGRIISFKNLDILKNQLSRCSLRRTTDVLNNNENNKLPPITFIDEYLDMEPSQKDFYEEFEKLSKGTYKEGLKQRLKDECDLINLQTNNLRALIIRLKQATTCPETLTSNENISSCKIDRAISLINEITENDNKVVVFSSFKAPIYTLSNKLKELGHEVFVGTGDINDQDIFNYMEEFQNANSKCKIFLATTQKMGTGFTLTEASYVIFLDQPWVEVHYAQAWGRVHRIGCKHPVFVYNLICENTIDEAVSKVLTRKKAISDYIVDDNNDSDTLKILSQYLSDL